METGTLRVCIEEEGLDFWPPGSEMEIGETVLREGFVRLNSSRTCICISDCWVVVVSNDP